MNGLATDLRARHVNDLVTIRVVENIVGVRHRGFDAGQEQQRQRVGRRKLFGRRDEDSRRSRPSLVGAVRPTRRSRAAARPAHRHADGVLTARVVEVLPNGDLVLEGVREIDINGDRQIVVLTGVVRAARHRAGNVVPSTAVGQMRIRYFGKRPDEGQPEPGWLIRALNKIF